MNTEWIHEESYSRFARHGRLYRLYQQSGDEEQALRHFEACARLRPEDQETARRWADLFGLHLPAR